MVKKLKIKKFFKEISIFFNPNESNIFTNITKENKIYLRNNFNIYFSFFIDEYSNNDNSDLIDIIFENNESLKIKLINNNIIQVCEKKKYLF